MMLSSSISHNTGRMQDDVASRVLVADFIIDYLNRVGVEYVFGIPGGAVEPLFDAIARSERGGGLRVVLTRHEAGAGYMAQAYAFHTQQVGVCITTSGPGAVNALTAVASAYQEAMPMLLISAQNQQSFSGCGAFQDSSCDGTDVLALFASCTYYNTVVSHPDQLAQKFVKAMQYISEGPVHISVPLDVLRMHAVPKTISMSTLERDFYPFDVQSFKRFAALIKASTRYVVVIGEGCKNAMASVMRFVEYTQSYIISTPAGKGYVNPGHPLFRGVFGFAGHDSARQVLSEHEIDYVLVIGATLSEWDSGAWDKILLNEKMIHVSASPRDFMRSPMACLHVLGQPGDAFDYLFEHVKLEDRANAGALETLCDMWRQRFSADKVARCASSLIDDGDTDAGVHPVAMMMSLGDVYPDYAMCYADVGNSMAWAIHYLQPNLGTRALSKPWFYSSTQFAAMGWAIGHAVGCAMAEPGRPVICITGDGSMLMSGQEITVAVEEKLAIVFIVMNDSALGMVRHGQALSGAESVANVLPKVNFCMMAEAMGADAFVIDDDAMFEQCLQSVFESLSGPVLLDVRVNQNIAAPIGMRIESLGRSA